MLMIVSALACFADLLLLVWVVQKGFGGIWHFDVLI